MKIVKMLMSWNCTEGELCGDSNYTLADNVANDLIADGRAEFVANVAEVPAIEQPAEEISAEATDAPVEKRSTRKKI